MSHFSIKSINLFLFILIILWLFFLCSYLFLSEFINAGSLTSGYKFGGDSPFFIGAAKEITNGLFPTDIEAPGYLGYIIFLSFFIFLKLPLFFVIIFQTLTTLICSILIYKITKKIYNNYAAYIAVSIYLFYFPLQVRNFYILTDLLFQDLITEEAHYFYGFLQNLSYYKIPKKILNLPS